MSMTTKNAKIEPEKHIWMVEIFPVFLGRRQGDRLKNTRRRRPIGHKRQLQMIDNPIHDGNLRDEGDDLHPAPLKEQLTLLLEYCKAAAFRVALRSPI